MKKTALTLILFSSMTTGCTPAQIVVNAVNFLPYVRGKYSTETFDKTDTYRAVFEGRDVPFDMR